MAGDEGKGRETIYVKGKRQQDAVLLASGDAFRSRRFSLVIKVTTVKHARSRYPITETGFGSLSNAMIANVEGI